MAGEGGVVRGKWRQLYLNNNKKKNFEKLYTFFPIIKLPKIFIMSLNNCKGYTFHTMIHYSCSLTYTHIWVRLEPHWFMVPY